MKRTISILLIVGIIVVINLLAQQFFFRWDVTEGKEYTLSNATKEVLKNLEDPILIKAYFTEDLPVDVDNIRQNFQELLVEYSTLSRGNVDYQFIDPASDQAIEQEALQSGIRPVLINVAEKDQSVQKKAFMGAVLSYGEQQEVMPFVSNQSPVEYDLTTAIKKMTVVDKPSIGFIESYGSATIAQLGQATQALSVIFSIESFNLVTEASIPERFETMVMIGTKDTVAAQDLAKLDDYLSRGGKLVLALDAVDGDFSTAQGNRVNTNIFDWLAAKGIQVEPSFIIDASCGSVTVQQKQGFFTINTPVSFPFLPIVKSFGDHPATKGLEAVIFQFASPITFTGDSINNFSPIITSSGRAGKINTPTYFNLERKWTNADYPLSNLTIGGVLDGNINGNPNAKLIVYSDGNFPVSGEQGRGVNPDNINLLANTIEWLSDDTGLSELRTKGVTTRPIDDIEDGKRNFLKWANFLAPILLAIIYGIVRNQNNRRKRLKRMAESYV